MKDWLKANRRQLWRWVGTILSFVLLAVLFYFNREDVSSALWRITPANLVVSFSFVFLSRLMTVARWYTLLRTGGIEISFKDTAKLTFTGLFASNFLPTSVGGDVVRLAGAMQMGYDRAICLGSIAADRLVNMAGMSLAAPLGLYQLIQLGALPSFALIGFWQRGSDFVRRTLASLKIWLRQPLALLTAFAFTLGNLLFTVGSYYFLVRGMQEYLPYWKLVGLASLSYFIGLMPFTINGYGWHDLSVTALFSQIGGLNVGVCAVIAVLQRLMMMLASLPGAITLPGVMAKMGASPEPAEDR